MRPTDRQLQTEPRLKLLPIIMDKNTGFVMYQNTGFYHDCIKILPFIKHIPFKIIVYNLHNLNKTNCKPLTPTNFTFMWLCDQPNLTLTLCILGLFQHKSSVKNFPQKSYAT